jgi:polysaccharide chain length determinant protein (PEP-CTERM system associated)
MKSTDEAPMDSFDLKKYLDMARRRIYWIIIPFLIVLLGGFYYILHTPKVYQASTLILVQAQKVPENYVRSVVSNDINDRLRTIEQQVRSRTNIEKIIEEHKIFDSSPEKDLLMEEKVDLFNKQLNITVSNRGGSGESSFSISFQGKDPKKVAEVANALVSNFTTENLKVRESLAIGTSDFLNDELESTKKQLIDKEEELKAYKQRYMGGLPEERESNLNMLTGLRNQLEQLNSNLRSAEDRKLTLQQTILTQPGVRNALGSVITSQTDTVDEMTTLKNQLASLKTRYTDNHPDVVQLKKRIASLEEDKKSEPSGDRSNSQSLTESNETSSQANANQGFNSQLFNVTQEISRLKVAIAEIENQIKGYEIRVAETPKREQELLSINRDYDNLKTLYNSMLSRKLESDVSVNLEKKQKGEQFNVLDFAKVPLKPIKPDIQKLSLLILALGLGLGCGLAYMIEFMDTSFRSPREIETEFNLPVLVTLPTIFTQTEIIKNKKKQIFAVASICVGFILCAVGIVVAAKGPQVSINYLKEILGKMN